MSSCVIGRRQILVMLFLYVLLAVCTVTRRTSLSSPRWIAVIRPSGHLNDGNWSFWTWTKRRQWGKALVFATLVVIAAETNNRFAISSRMTVVAAGFVAFGSIDSFWHQVVWALAPNPNQCRPESARLIDAINSDEWSIARAESQTKRWAMMIPLALHGEGWLFSHFVVWFDCCNSFECCFSVDAVDWCFDTAVAIRMRTSKLLRIFNRLASAHIYIYRRCEN